VLKADVQGSLEAVTESLQKLERDEVKLAVRAPQRRRHHRERHQLAAATNATIIGFNVRPDRKIRDGRRVRRGDPYLRDHLQAARGHRAAMVGMLAPEYEEVVTGEAEVREVFRVPKIGAIAGC
jgi:translation initiation factor IF-2